MNINRKRLLDSFNRAHSLANHIAKTKDFLENYHRIQLNFKPDSLIIYHQWNSFIEQRFVSTLSSRVSMRCLRCRKENPFISSKTSFHLQIHPLKKRLQINRITLDEIQENLILINQDQSCLFNQISHINNNRFHLNEYLQSLDDKSRIIQEQISCLRKKIDQSRLSTEENQDKLQRRTREIEYIVRSLLEKQHWIVRLNKQFELMEKIREESRWNLDQLCSKLQPIRVQILGELSSIKYDKIASKQLIFSLRKQLLESRKKENHFQHRQILTKIVKKQQKNSFKPNSDQQDIDLHKKASSIMHRLINKTVQNIHLHHRWDFLLINHLTLHRTHSQINVNRIQWTNRIQSSLAQLRVLKIELLLHKDTLNKLRTTFEEKTGSRLSGV